MSAIRSWNPFSRRARRTATSSPYARNHSTQQGKSEDSSWSISGIINFITGATQSAALPTESEQGSPPPPSELPSAQTSLNANTCKSTVSPPPRTPIIEIFDEDEIRELPQAAKHAPPAPQPVASGSVLPAITPTSSPMHPTDQVQAFLERKKQEGTPLNDMEYAGIVSMLEKVKEQTYEPEPFRFSRSPTTPTRTPQPDRHSPVTPSRKSGFSGSTSLPTFTNSASSIPNTRRKTLGHDPNGVYRWMGGGSSRVSPSPNRRNSPSRRYSQTPLKVDNTKRRRVGEDKEESSAEPTGSKLSTSQSTPAMGSNGLSAGPSTPPRYAPNRISRASLIPKTTPAMPSPLRHQMSVYSPPGSPPSVTRSSPTSVNSAHVQPQSQPQQTRAAGVLTDLIQEVTPQPKPDIANPYQTASPVKPLSKPKERKRMSDRRAREKVKEAEKLKEKEKRDDMPSPKTIIEATVPKGAKRSRPPPGFVKSTSSKTELSESQLFGDHRGEEVYLNGNLKGDHDIPMIEEPEDELEAPPIQRKKARSVTIEEVEDDDMADSTSYTKPSEVIEPSESSGLLRPSPAAPGNSLGSSPSPSTASGFSNGNGSKSSMFGPGKSSLPKEPSKLRSSFIAEEEESEAEKVKSAPKSVPLPSPPMTVPSNAPPTTNLFDAALFSPQKPKETSAPKDPKDVAMAIAESDLPLFSFEFAATPTSGYADARAAALAVPLSSLPTFDFSKAFSSSTSSKANGLSFPSSSASSSAPKAFDWAAAGLKPVAAKDSASWTCDTCMLSNPASASVKCTVCDAPRPGAGSETLTKAPAPSMPKSFTMPTPPITKVTPGPAPEVKAFDWAAAGMKPQVKNTGESWTCGTCMLSNPASAITKCTVCDTPRS